VLELGAGTGANLDHWPRGPIASLLLTEPDPAMARRLERRVARREAAAQVVRAPADALPVPDASVDTVVASLVLCTVPDVPAALAEVRRVLAPGGRLLFLEHVRHADPARAGARTG
jgi:ubiquinone/menaquinone biosynthesis C-methylase UbiE